MQMSTCPRCRSPLVQSLTCPVCGLVLTRRDVALTLGSAGQRLLAYMIDVFIIALVFTGGLILVGFVGGYGLRSVGAVAFLLLIWLAAVCFVVFFSIGKRLVGLRIVTLDGLPASTGTGMLRGVIGKYVLGLLLFPLFYPIFDALWLIWDRDRQCLHDKLANTLVVRADPALDLAPGADHAWTFGAGEQPPPFGPPRGHTSDYPDMHVPKPSQPAGGVRRPAAGTSDERLQHLERARDEGRLTDEQYRQWKQRIRRDMERSHR